MEHPGNSRTPSEYFPVLVAEDDPVNSIHLKMLLEKHGYSVDLAHDGSEALRMWQEHKKYKVILMDIRMPGTDGIEATEEIRKTEEKEHRKPVKIIGISAYGEGDEKDEMYSVGITDYITKPIQTHRLLSLISSSENREGERPDAPSDSEEYSEQYKTRLLQKFSDGKETLGSMLRMSLQELPQRLEAIDNAIRESDSERAAEQCHSLANVAGILLAEDLRDKTLEMEQLLREHNVEAVSPRFKEIQRKTEALLESFRAILSEKL